MGEDEGEEVGGGDGGEGGGEHGGEVGQRGRAEQEGLQGGGGRNQVWGRHKLEKRRFEKNEERFGAEEI